MRADIAVVGAPALIGQDVVYIYRYDGIQWNQEQILIPFGSGIDFGESLDISGDRLIIGCDRGNQAYIFQYDGASWSLEKRLVASDLNGWDRFGCDVAIDGDVAIVGNSDDDDRCPSPNRPFCDSGSAYIYRFDGQTWVEEQKLIASDSQREDYFGWTVAMDGDIAAIGALFAADISRGKVYVFRCVEGQWQEEAILPPPTPSTNTFGYSLDLRKNRNLLVVGAPATSGLPGTIRSVLLYRYDGLDWLLTETLTASDGASAMTAFGSSVSISGDRLLVGAYGADDFCPENESCDSGAVFFFDADGSCEAGQVGAMSGPPSDVLLINGSAGDAERAFITEVNVPLDFSLLTSPDGPMDASYLLYVWRGYPSRCTTPSLHGLSAGCLVNPTPVDQLLGPQPFRCFRSPGIPDAACRGIRELPAPPSAPWTLGVPNGLPARAVFTLQGFVQDDGSTSPVGYSSTNTVVLDVR